MSAIDLRIPVRVREIVPGTAVRRVLPWMKRRSVGPFVFLDHMGPLALPPGEAMDVGPHPHIGLATVTYLFQGRVLHRDSLGSVQLIEPGAVNWMTAGRGIVHSERTPAEDRAAGYRLHGVQIWVALPADQEEIAPAFAHHDAAALPQVAPSPQAPRGPAQAAHGGAQVRVIVGTAYGVRSPVATLSPMFLADAHLPPGATLEVPGDFPERALYPVQGELTVGADGGGGEPPVGENTMAVLGPGPVILRAVRESRVLLLGGTPLGPRQMWWNFVSTRPERIEQAKQDWRAMRFPEIPGETGYIPLPEAP